METHCLNHTVSGSDGSHALLVATSVCFLPPWALARPKLEFMELSLGVKGPQTPGPRPQTGRVLPRQGDNRPKRRQPQRKVRSQELKHLRVRTVVWACSATLPKSFLWCGTRFSRCVKSSLGHAPKP